ncbi:hypothetical protein B296_00013517 [Ensete ventricosum]|uniref:Uncharacterized protein n=1 Tax=Ensete ventricosum TaxID=4639 RepID=A0A426YR35_ENSVE|nr:hypothetical protein B296_00013517 [Ensete ventricosum]
MKLQPNDGPRYNLGIELSSDDAVGSRRKFVRRFVEGIEKLARNMKGDCRKKTEGLAVRLLVVVGVCGTTVGPLVPQISGGSQQVSVGKPSRRRLDRVYHRLRVATND